MRILSYWAKHHVAYARIILLVCHGSLAVIACFLGTTVTGIELSPFWTGLLAVALFAVAATYPGNKKNYTRRKLYDFLIASGGFLLIFCVANQLNKPLSFYQTVAAIKIVEPSPYKFAEAKKLLEQFHKGEKTSFTAKEKRFIKKEFKYQLGQYAKAKVLRKKATTEQVLLIILACIAAVGLLYLVAALSCSIACSGADALAVIVLIAGTAGIVWGLVNLIRLIKKKKREPETKN